jgi:hypothetical protein
VTVRSFPEVTDPRWGEARNLNVELARRVISQGDAMQRRLLTTGREQPSKLERAFTSSEATIPVARLTFAQAFQLTSELRLASH